MGWCVVYETDLQKLKDEVVCLRKEIDGLKKETHSKIKDKRDCFLYLPPKHTCETCLAKKEGRCFSFIIKESI